MSTLLTPHATEGSTYVITVSYFDEDGVATVPQAVTWTLTDAAGAVVNAREDVDIDTPGLTNDIVLSGLDLALEGYDGPDRALTVEGTYTSDLGAGLPFRAECWFTVDGLLVAAEAPAP